MKPYRILHILLLVGALTLTQTSCNKVLELDPLDQLSDAAYWKTPNDFMLAANQYYLFLRTFTDAVSDNPHADIRSDIVGGQNAFSRGTNTVPTTDGVWNSNYSGSVPTGAWSRIRVINYLLDKAATYPNPTEIAKYVAEAKFFRAYIYFDLVQLYGGVPIVDKILGPNSSELQGPRNSRDEVTDFILKDINDAITALPAKTAQTAAELGRINKESAQAFLSRVALYEGTWQKFRNNTARANTLLDMAISASGAVITGGQYSLFAPAALGDSAQKYLFILENQKSNPANITKTANTEYIVVNRYDQTLRQIRFNISHTGTGAPTRTFANLYLCKDGLPIEKSPLFQGYAKVNSEYQNRETRMRYNLGVPGAPSWQGNANWRVDWVSGPADLANALKGIYGANPGYGSSKFIAERQVADNEEGYDYPVIRYAEVLLTYAEAVFERNGTISDADLDKSLNLTRLRINKTMPKLSNQFVQTNGLDMRTEIRRERTVEFWAEGFRTDDLKRWHNAVELLAQPELSTKWTGTEFEKTYPAGASAAKDADGVIIIDAVRSFSEKNYLWPIPSQQLQLNPKLEQNPGW
ncbi:RagB/SusD family nutrient uptake outer membrane protein [Spirosoma sp. HMF4905]|uniref:RagB/SusD family nutrient uptake outer membrane protein n=1 Tax=Spirosoma arboris TaxID=2682092 RepID=A0A7K1SQH0_9BACT|nr:RagB/SusD family nutrient uptake outer membrane protein [Spirosoma arboris]MVM35990.1 RagB/SusD family nutrient uptake outer membrane protein [Spirosoma arboris]